MKSESHKSQLHRHFQIGVVRVKNLIPVFADVAWEFSRHLMKAPPVEWTLQKHLPATGVDGLAIFHWFTFLEPVGQRAADSTCIKDCSQSQAGHQSKTDAHALQNATFRKKDQDGHGSGKRQP